MITKVFMEALSPTMEEGRIASWLKQEGDTVTVDLAAGHVVLPSGETMPFHPLPPNILEILNAGGLVPKLRAELAAKSG